MERGTLGKREQGAFKERRSDSGAKEEQQEILWEEEN